MTNELSILQEFISIGIPCLLVDITNSIRYGDVCLLLEPEPQFIEVKSSSVRMNKRTRRQLRDIRKIHSFYKDDEIHDLRGIPYMRRVAAVSREQNYVEEFNECIKSARATGFCRVFPEAGLSYAVFYHTSHPFSDMFDGDDRKKARLFFLNEFKSNLMWTHYVPFTLNIFDEAHLFDFVRGDLLIVVLWDLGVFSDMIRKEGFEIVEDGAEDYLRFRHRESDGISGIAWQMLDRVGFEFVSPRWLVEDIVRRVERWSLESAEGHKRP